MGARRRSRAERPPAARYRITKRDLELLHAIARMKLASTRQIAALFFGHPTAATRRLAKLFALGLVVVHCVDLNRDNLIGLTPKGASLLVENGAAEGEIHVVRRVERHDPHLHAINDLRVGLVRAARERSDIRCGMFLADHDLRRVLGRQATHAPYIPDSLVRLEIADGRELHLAYEIDLGTEWSAHLREKITHVHELARTASPLYGLSFPWRPIVVAPDAARSRAIAKLIVDEGGQDFWALALLDGATSEPFGARYALARDLAAPDAAGAFRRRLVPTADEVSLRLSQRMS